MKLCETGLISSPDKRYDFKLIFLFLKQNICYKYSGDGSLKHPKTDAMSTREIVFKAPKTDV